jgi:hypothetical protein
MNLFEKENEIHELVFAKSGQGKSIFSEILKNKTKKENGIIIDLENNPDLKGFLPFEYAYVKKMVFGNKKDKFPRGLKKKFSKRSILFLSKQYTDSFKYIEKAKDLTIIKTKNAKVKRYLLSDARTELFSQSGIQLNEIQMIELIEEFNIDKDIELYNEVETMLRDNLANAISLKLIGENWPTFGELKGCSIHDYSIKNSLSFVERLKKEAINYGYKIIK